MTEFITSYHLFGLITGVCTFLIIGLFHPLVIKGEYKYGTPIRLAFLAAGIVCAILCVLVSDLFLSTLLGVTSFSCFWSIKEVVEQEERVRKGWFPRNPSRHYPWDKD